MLVAFANALHTITAELHSNDTNDNQNNNASLPSNVLPIVKKKFPLLDSIACEEPIFAD